MKKIIKKGATQHAGDQLKLTVRFASFGGLFLSLFGTGLVWAGTESFHCTPIVWKTSLALNFLLSVLAWIVYLPFRDTDRLLGRGLLALFLFLSIFWIFGFAGFYFYFIFAPISIWARITATTALTASLLYRAHLINCDIIESFQKNKHLFDKIYRNEADTFTYDGNAFLLLQKNRRDRNPFKPIHAYAAMIVAPFIFILNRVLTPVFGDGHGIFLVLAFFCVPILLFGIEIVVQAVITMIYYPIKLERETGKPVLMKDW